MCGRRRKARAAFRLAADVQGGKAPKIRSGPGDDPHFHHENLRPWRAQAQPGQPNLKETLTGKSN